MHDLHQRPALWPTQQCCPNQRTEWDEGCYPIKGGLSNFGPQSPPPYRPRTITETEETPRFLSFPGASPAKRNDSDAPQTTGPTHWTQDFHAIPGGNDI